MKKRGNMIRKELAVKHQKSDLRPLTSILLLLFLLSVVSAIDFASVGDIYTNFRWDDLKNITASWDEYQGNLFYNNGNVGIGIMTPNSKLQIAGNVSIGGVLYMGNNKISNLANGSLDTDAVTLSQLKAVNISATAAETDPKWTGNWTNVAFKNAANTFTENIVLNKNLTVDTNTLFVNSNTDRVGIGTLTPNSKLQVAGNASIGGILYMNNNVITGLANGTAATDAVTKAQLDAVSSVVTGDFVPYSGATKNLTLGTFNISGNLGSFNKLRIANNEWISGVDSSGTGLVNMFKVNPNNEIDVGGTLNIGTLSFSEDSGLVTAMDMPVSSLASVGTPEGYVFRVDSDNILSVYSESDGSGGVTNKRVGIGTISPTSTLDVNGTATIRGALTMNNNKITGLANASSDTDAVTYSQLQTVNSSSVKTETDPKWTGNWTSRTGTGNVVYSTSPTLTTPNIGVATGTSLNVTGLIKGGNIDVSSGGAYLYDGVQALKLRKDGSEYTSTVVGYNAGLDASGPYQTAVGYNSGYNNTGSSQTAVGYNSGWYNTGSSQTAIGSGSGWYNTGSSQTAIGSGAGYLNTGSFQTTVGSGAGYLNTGSFQTAIGSGAGQSNTGDNLVAIGYQAGINNALSNQFIVKQANVNSVPLIQGDFATGNVGIGTTTPQKKFHVNGTKGGLLIDVDNADTNHPTINTTSGNITISSAGGSVIIKLG